jgi:hypothetical protein
MTAWTAFLLGMADHPLPYEQSRASMLLTFAVLESIQQGRSVRLSGDVLPQRWKNGGGIPTELAVHPASGRPLWRASIAEVALDGPFSDYAGYERTIMLMEGRGMVLAFDRADPARIDAPFVPFTFDGAWRCDCTLIAGPVRDMNLMVDRETARGTIEVVRPRGPMARELRAEWTLLYVLSGAARASLGGNGHSMAAGELLRVDGAGDRLSLDADGIDPAVARHERLHAGVVAVALEPQDLLGQGVHRRAKARRVHAVGARGGVARKRAALLEVVEARDVGHPVRV